MIHSPHGIQLLQGCPRALFWASCVLMTFKNLLVLKLLLMIIITIYHQVPSMQDCHFLQENLNFCLQCTWCSHWQMTLNSAKVKHCVFITKVFHLLLYATVYIDQPILWKQRVKYLGVHLNQRLSWGNHCKYVQSKATRILNFLWQKLYGCSQKWTSRWICNSRFIYGILHPVIV